MNKFTIQQLQQMRVGEEPKTMSDAMYSKILQESEPDFSEKICEGHSPKTSNGIQLTPLYEGMKFRAGVTDRTEYTNVPVNVLVNVPNLATMLGVSEKTIKRDIAAMQSAGLIKRVGSDKTGHWEVVNQ